MAKNVRKAQKNKAAQKKAITKRSKKAATSGGAKANGPNRKSSKKIAKHLKPQKEKIAKLLSHAHHERFAKETDVKVSIVTGKVVERERKRPATAGETCAVSAEAVESGADSADEDDSVDDQKSAAAASGAARKNDAPTGSGMAAAFGKKLSHTEKHVRDQGFRALQKWLKRQAPKLDALEFVKLWKALWYALWLADKKPVQQDLSVQMAKLTEHIPRNKLAAWVCAFFEVFSAEWKNLDYWRMNKFMLMVRIQLAETLAQVGGKYAFDEELVEEVNDAFLSVAPLCADVDGHFNPGFTNHFLACFWDELAPVIAAIPRAGISPEPVTADASASSSTKSLRQKNRKTQKMAAAQQLEKDKNAKSEGWIQDRVLHLLEPIFQVLVDASFPDHVQRTLVKEILGPKLPAFMRKPASEELFSIGSDEGMPLPQRKKINAICQQLDSGVENVELPERKVNINPKLEAPQKRLRPGLGVRTRNQRKVRQRDKR